MSEIKLKVLSVEGFTRMVSPTSSNVSLVFTDEYQEGDRISVEYQGSGCYCIIQLEDSMPEALVYCDGNINFNIPFAEGRISYSPKSFTGNRHLIRARIVNKTELPPRRNLAFNPYDQHTSEHSFPHAKANVETRNEAVFAARNAIDGIYENMSHGEWPYQSWGINRDPKAELQLDFGRDVIVDEIRLTLRSDFPHDSYWTAAKVDFSDGSSETLNLKKKSDPQIFPITPRKITWAKLHDLIKADDASPFPALTQIEYWGIEA